MAPIRFPKKGKGAIAQPSLFEVAHNFNLTLYISLIEILNNNLIAVILVRLNAPLEGWG
jgi:hypothetical protein